MSDTLAAVLKTSRTGPRCRQRRLPLRRLLRRCLEKDRKRRLRRHRGRATGDRGRAAPGARVVGRQQTPRRRRHAAARTAGLDWMAALAVAAVVIVAMAVPTVRHLRETPPPSPPETRIEIVTPATTDPISFALSPDGRQIVFVASGDGASRLWLRSLRQDHRAAAGRNRGRGLSLLVARQPLGRLLRRWQAEAARHRRRRAANIGNGNPAAAGPGTRTASSCLRQPQEVRCSACRPREARPWR